MEIRSLVGVLSFFRLLERMAQMGLFKDGFGPVCVIGGCDMVETLSSTSSWTRGGV